MRQWDKGNGEIWRKGTQKEGVREGRPAASPSVPSFHLPVTLIVTLHHGRHTNPLPSCPTAIPAPTARPSPSPSSPAPAVTNLKVTCCPWPRRCLTSVQTPSSTNHPLIHPRSRKASKPRFHASLAFPGKPFLTYTIYSSSQCHCLVSMNTNKE